MTNSNGVAASVGAAVCLISGVFATPALADAICSKDVAVLAQPRDGLTILEKYKAPRYFKWVNWPERLRR